MEWNGCIVDREVYHDVLVCRANISFFVGFIELFALMSSARSQHLYFVDTNLFYYFWYFTATFFICQACLNI